MRWKTPAMLSLLFLAAAAAPPGDCLSGSDSGLTLPTAVDLAGRPNIPAGLTAQTFAALPGADAAGGCRGALPSASASATLRSESGDVLHGLPAPDLLQPMDESRRAPQFR
jgi:hypothetical protein